SSGTTNDGGKLVVNSIISGGGYLLINPSGTLGGNGTNVGSVEIASGGAFEPGNITPGTFRAGGDFKVSFGSYFTNKLSTATTIGGGVNDLIDVGGNLDASGGTFMIKPVAPLTAGSYTLMRYAGSPINLSFEGVQTAFPTRYNFTLDTATAGFVKVNVTGGPANLRWNGDTTLNTWDVNNFATWIDQATTFSSSFLNFDSVLF